MGDVSTRFSCGDGDASDTGRVGVDACGLRRLFVVACMKASSDADDKQRKERDGKGGDAPIVDALGGAGCPFADPGDGPFGHGVTVQEPNLPVRVVRDVQARKQDHAARDAIDVRQQAANSKRRTRRNTPSRASAIRTVSVAMTRPMPTEYAT